MRNRKILALSVFATGLFAQTPELPTFEVASVKPSDPREMRIGLLTFPGGRIMATLNTLEMLIEEAYSIQPFQLSGGPAWMRTDRFDVQAKPPVSSMSSKSNPPYSKAPMNQEQRLMLQSLLRDRFQLEIRRSIKDGPIYRLERDEGRVLKLREPKDREAYPWAGSNAGGSLAGDGMAGVNITMPLFAVRLSSWLQRPVVDATGLAGAFDFKFEILPDGDAHPDIVAATFTAVQAIGLRLRSAKGPVEYFSVGRAEKPSAN